MPERNTRLKAVLRRAVTHGGAFGLELENLLGYNLRRAHGVQKERFTAIFEPLGIRPVTLSLLGTVYDEPGITQTELGKRLHIKRANMVPLLTELEARGLIARRPSDNDRRARDRDALTDSRQEADSQAARDACASRERPRAEPGCASERPVAGATEEVPRPVDGTPISRTPSSD